MPASFGRNPGYLRIRTVRTQGASRAPSPGAGALEVAGEPRVPGASEPPDLGEVRAPEIGPGQVGVLQVRLDEVGPLSLSAARAEPVSGICAVLAETDVINLVSRGIPTAEILRGIHESVALRLAKLLQSARATGPVLVTGGLAADTGLVTLLSERMNDDGGTIKLEILTHPRSAWAGAIGAALWGAFRRRKLAEAPPMQDDAVVA